VSRPFGAGVPAVRLMSAAHVPLSYCSPLGFDPCARGANANTHIAMQSAEIQLRFRELEAQFRPSANASKHFRRGVTKRSFLGLM
jgi:hypothetical protein